MCQLSFNNIILLYYYFIYCIIFVYNIDFALFYYIIMEVLTPYGQVSKLVFQRTTAVVVVWSACANWNPGPSEHEAVVTYYFPGFSDPYFSNSLRMVFLTTGPQPLRKLVLHRVRSDASCFKFQYVSVSLKPSSSHLSCFPVASILPVIFPSIMCFSRLFYATSDQSN